MFELRPTLAPPDPAAPLRFTVQTLEPDGPSEVGEHPRLLIVKELPTEIEPPVAVTEIPTAPGVAPSALDTPIVEFPAAGDMVTAIVATTPLEILLSLMPSARQTWLPGLEEQVIDLPAAVKAGPAETEKLLTLAVG